MDVSGGKEYICLPTTMKGFSIWVRTLQKVISHTRLTKKLSFPLLLGDKQRKKPSLSR